MRLVDINENQIGVTHDSPEQLFFQETENVALERELLKLEERERNVILLKDIDRYTFQEIANSMRMKLPTIKSIYRRAKMKLAKKLGDIT